MGFAAQLTVSSLRNALVAGAMRPSRVAGQQAVQALVPRRTGYSARMRGTTSTNEIRTAIRELSVRAELARKEGRHQDADEIGQRIDAYRSELSERP